MAAHDDSAAGVDVIVASYSDSSHNVHASNNAYIPWTRSGSCDPVLFVGARGSGEYGPGSARRPRGRKKSDRFGFGSDVNEVFSLLKGAVGGRHVEPDSVRYGADRVTTILHDPAKYFRDLSAGVGWTMTDLTDHAQPTACPHQQIVLAGFSQGAMVMHRVLHQLGRTASGRMILSRVAAAVLIGDGDQVPFDRETRFGSAFLTATGIGQVFPPLSGSSLTRFSRSLGPRILRVCNYGDAVCDAGRVGLVAGILIHLSYPGSRPLRQAAAQAASDVLHPASRR